MVGAPAACPVAPGAGRHCRRAPAGANGFRGAWRRLANDALRARRRAHKRKRQLEQLRARLREFTETLPDGAVLLDRELRVQWWNPAAAKCCHLDTGIQGMAVEDLLPDVPIRELMQRGELGNLRVAGGPGGRALELRLVRSSKYRYLLLVRDVSEFEEVERCSARSTVTGAA
jgi:two-component system phosphate regulon sensor histidine kinase PhoR